MTRMDRRISSILEVVLVIVLASSTTQRSCSSANTPPRSVNPVHGWDVYYNWQIPSGATPKSTWLSDITMEVGRDPGNDTYYYWSHFTFFTDKQPASGHTLMKEPGAYVGLQTNGNHRSLVFSVWNGVSGIPDKSPAGVRLHAITNMSTSYCKPFNDDTAGYHCMYTYNWKPHTPYRLRMELVSRSAWGDSIRGSVLDVDRGQEVIIGEIFVPAFYGVPSCSVVFYEYFGSVADCRSIPEASVTFSNISLVFKTGSKSIPASWSSVSSMLNGAGGGSCVGWANLDICNSLVVGSSPAPYFLTEAPANRCGLGSPSGWRALEEVTVWEQQQQQGETAAVLSRLPRLATWLY